MLTNLPHDSQRTQFLLITKAQLLFIVRITCDTQTYRVSKLQSSLILTLWRRNYFFLILAHSVYKM